MTVALRNAYLEVAIRPECGARIDQITDLVRGKTWLWHPPEYDPAAPRNVPDGASFDAYWQGGFEEMFPNDAACIVDGRALPDHGETWSTEWQARLETPHTLDMSTECRTVPVRVEKRVTLEPDAPVLHVRYRLTNLGEAALPCMLKLHPAIAIEEGDEIDMPDCLVEPVAIDFSTVIGRDEKSRWPEAVGVDGDPVRLDRTLPVASELREFVYCSELGNGRCGIRNPRTSSQLEFRFDPATFPFVWVFQSYGGFHGRYVLMLEPCTSKPYDLRDVIAEDTALWLAPDATRTLAVTLRVG